jgi:hypothetical protein
MFSFTREAQMRAGRLEAQNFLARLANQRALEKMRALEEHRLERRTQLSIGVLVVPLSGDLPVMTQTFAALTNDVSTTGMCIVADRSIPTAEAIICLPGDPEAVLLRATVHDSKKLGLGWVRIGMEISGMAKKSKYPELAPIVSAITTAEQR